MTVYPYILSGGSGTRLWPLSRRSKPKQLQPILAERTLLQQALARAQRVGDEPPVVIANQSHRFTIAEQAAETGVTGLEILLEPEGRNTAPAAIIAALHCQQRTPTDDPVLLLMPSDHLITDEEAFALAVKRAAEAAREDAIVLFGIKPDRAETAYGYIKPSAEGTCTGVRSIELFVEKPDAPIAADFVKSGDYFWNSGIFVFGAQTLLREAERYIPETLAACREALKDAKADLDFVRLDGAAFSRCQNISLDHAIMEKTDAASVLVADFPWSDLGSWDAVWQQAARDSDGNSLSGDAIVEDCQNSLIQSSQGRLVAGLGLRDVAVIDTPDALLVMSRDRAQDVRQLVDRLGEKDRPEVRDHRRVHRPWGWYESIDSGANHQVKILNINPGGKLSLQSHKHRSEHWVVVRGAAQVTLDKDVRQVSENESIYVPAGTVHRLENPGKTPTQIIEVQTGSYFGEDDIVRLDDIYGRLPHDGDENDSGN
jgi:mannose-1-phosphate guanylyltransferase/mannose-6-phosphate isomerase